MVYWTKLKQKLKNHSFITCNTYSFYSIVTIITFLLIICVYCIFHTMLFFLMKTIMISIWNVIMTLQTFKYENKYLGGTDPTIKLQMWFLFFDNIHETNNCEMSTFETMVIRQRCKIQFLHSLEMDYNGKYFNIDANCYFRTCFISYLL